MALDKMIFSTDLFRRKTDPPVSHINILMVCTGNICRSPMAEGLLRQRLPEALKTRVTVESAGTHAFHGNTPEPFAVKAAAGCGADISGHRARLVGINMLKRADMVIAMEKAHRRIIKKYISSRKTKLFVIGEFDPEKNLHEIEDPYGLPIEAYEECAKLLIPCLDGIITHMEKQLKSIDG